MLYCCERGVGREEQFTPASLARALELPGVYARVNLSSVAFHGLVNGTETTVQQCQC